MVSGTGGWLVALHLPEQRENTKGGHKPEGLLLQEAPPLHVCCAHTPPPLCGAQGTMCRVPDNSGVRGGGKCLCPMSHLTSS